MRVTMTAQGFQSLQFTDQAGNRCIAEQSREVDPSNPTSDHAGSSYLLLGRQDAPVQLSIDQVGELVEYLEKWLENGQFVRSAPNAADRGVPAPHLVDREKRRGSFERTKS